jgi:2-polyprenyl-6-methoxyphenol hydroxylase-like FAD-dependent oxidoreductase
VLRERCDVLGLVVDAQGRIAGARVRWRDREDASDGGEEEVLAADLVVDASGRGSRAPVWLQALGWGLPPKDEIVVGLSYTTFELGRTTPDPDAVSLVVGATVDRPRGGVLLAQPDGRWVATLGGYLGDAAPIDLEGFRRFAAGMPTPRVAEALDELTPIGPARTFKYHASTWRRYDRMRRFPDGFLVFGDAICSFNPIFGQGMTVAAREALALRDCLRRQGTARLARRFFTAARREIANPWEIAASSDLRLPAVLGRRTAKVRMTNAYLPHYFRAAQRDVGLGLDFLRVVNLLARPESLLSPTRMARVVGRRDRSPSTAPTAETRVPAERPDAA